MASASKRPVCSIWRRLSGVLAVWRTLAALPLVVAALVALHGSGCGRRAHIARLTRQRHDHRGPQARPTRWTKLADDDSVKALIV